MAVRILTREATAAELLTDLAAAVDGVGPGASLANKVAEAQQSLAAGNTVGTCSVLSAFVSELTAQAGKKISVEEAAALTAAAEEIRGKLGC